MIKTRNAPAMRQTIWMEAQPQKPPRPEKPTMTAEAPLKAEAKNLSFSYGSFRALKDINIRILKNHVTALIGPSGCGKSTFLRCFNRMHDLYPNSKYEGEITLPPGNINIIDPKGAPTAVSARVGVVFERPAPVADTR